ncbi:type II/III secretion system protein [Burkholderia pseudomallei]|uniref:type II and III secretion system protein family protein n=1 Tax=Burkholderia pseudomallei TaxID=28450 RepID=UPI0002EE4F8A|nr:type II and III secretion system protein family protein [Burkholderia pseudomallei]AIP50026.1 bacterial type II and III secretion system family protein [Burkholderia pseudomallei HBPUB10134a]AIV63901.1 bacterial type II and III secretion system family protein [Burkholderia pseudomallei K42]AJW53007.1 membrane protein [Burkholderia pseudomallei]AJX37616.1 bacterial type II and III secretion system family protein [Burkholderia pseudomallei]KGC68041.1 bacterial type II and III secretion system
MKNKLIAWAVAFGVLLSFAARAAETGTIELAAGTQRQIAVGHGVQRVAIADPNVADVLVIKGGRGGVLLVAKAAGTTSLMVWERGRDEPAAYTVNVVSGAARALLDGGSPSVKAYNGTAVVAGSAATLDAHARALAVGKGMAGKDGGVLDVSTVGGKNVVQVDVRVVEFSRSVLKQAGLNFFKQNNGFTFGSFAPAGLASVTGGGTSSMSVSANIPIASAFNLVVGSATRGLFADLSILEANNLARVLAQPTLVALSGQSASFLAGGEIPVPVPQSLGTISIDWKPYGVGLTLTPTVLSPRRIALKVAPESSQLDFVHSITINGVTVPALTTRRADTTVELGDGESFVIGGLIDRETTSNVDKVPFLGDLPIIGTFFKHLSYQQNDKELVIIVTPHLVAPIAKNASLPATPGELSEQRDGPVWRSYLGGVLSPDAGPGFSK